MRNAKEKDGLTTFGRVSAEFLYAFNMAPESRLIPYLAGLKQKVFDLYSDQAALYLDQDDPLRRDRILASLRGLIAEQLISAEIDILMELTKELEALSPKEPEWR